MQCKIVQRTGITEIYIVISQIYKIIRAELNKWGVGNKSTVQSQLTNVDVKS
jgi:hypothetical protein